MSSSTLAVEPFDAQLDFGCRVAGLSSLRSVSDADIATLATAFQQHGLVVIPKVAGLQPELELELYHRVHEKLWPAAAVSTRPRPPYSARDAHPPGFPEINVIGKGTVSRHFGLDGVVLRTCSPWEEHSTEWHNDNPDGSMSQPMTWLSCHAAPTVPGGVIRPGGEPGAEIACDAGATLFASGYLAVELSPEAEQRRLEQLNVRGWPDTIDSDAVDYPRMAPCGCRVLSPPVAAPDSSSVDSGSQTHPLVSVHPHTGRRSLCLEPVSMRRLEHRGDGSALGWDDSQETVARALRLATAPDRMLALNWSKGDIAFWDNRAVFHSRSPAAWYMHADGNAPQRVMHQIRLSAAPAASSRL
jgi:alpha-ketoglutarate-dependent taurine dioxygenase